METEALKKLPPAPRQPRIDSVKTKIKNHFSRPKTKTLFHLAADGKIIYNSTKLGRGAGCGVFLPI